MASVAVTYNKDGGTNNFALYIDGIRVTSRILTGAINTNTNNVLIGNNSTNTLIDEVRIWNRSLILDELAFEYETTIKEITTAGEIPTISEDANVTIVLSSLGSSYFDNVKVKAGPPKIRFVVPYQIVDIVNQTRLGPGDHNIVIKHYGTNTTGNRPMIGLSRTVCNEYFKQMENPGIVKGTDA